MPFAIIGFFLAYNDPNTKIDWIIFLKVILCMIFARNAAMAYNRYLDREIDSNNPRTLIREIPAGKINPRSALLFVIINSLLFVVTTAFINKLTLFLSPIALLVILGYSITKRFTALCHFILGIGLSLAPIGAYLAVTGVFNLIPVIFSIIVLLWVSGFDIIYALQDEKIDKKLDLFSIPNKLGQKKALYLSTLIHLLTSILVVVAGFLLLAKLHYWIGASIFILLLFYQHTLVKPNKLNKVNLAFFTLNGIGSVLYATFVVLELLT